MTVGRTYRLTGWARGDGAAIPLVGTGAASLWSGTTSTVWQYFDLTFIAGATDVWFYCNNLAAGRSVGFDDLSLRLMETVTEVIGKSGITEALMGTTGLVTTEFPGIARPRGFSFDGGDRNH